jgi:hypothetical protein
MFLEIFRNSYMATLQITRLTLLICQNAKMHPNIYVIRSTNKTAHNSSRLNSWISFICTLSVITLFLLVRLPNTRTLALRT